MIDMILKVFLMVLLTLQMIVLICSIYTMKKRCKEDAKFWKEFNEQRAKFYENMELKLDEESEKSEQDTTDQ